MSKAHTLPKSERKKSEQKNKVIGKWEVENEEWGQWIVKKMHLV